MKKSFKFRVAMFVVLTSLLSGCFPGYGWDHDGDRGGGRGGEHRDRGDRGGDRGGDRDGDHGDHR